MGAFEYCQAEQIRQRFSEHGVRYLFLENRARLCSISGHDAGRALVSGADSENSGALRELGFSLDSSQSAEIERGRDFIQLKDGDLDLIFAPDGIERFEGAWRRHVNVEKFPVCHPDDIVASKAATNRQKDRESPLRLRSFRNWWMLQSR
ncbi:MAG: hypothetical protein M3032_07500 [Verrucomicrobiota bacterium]|nr:hypothetical protein [Verrucomicrobiota bacterium]